MNNLRIIKNPRITEKASMLLAENVYIFDIPKGANKKEIKKTISQIYKVVPVKINLLPVPNKKIFIKGKAQVKSGGRKAMVYLKEGDKIEFI